MKRRNLLKAIGVSRVAMVSGLNAEEHKEIIADIPRGMGDNIGISHDKWYAAVLMVPSYEDRFASKVISRDYTSNLKELRKWIKTPVNTLRQIILVEQDSKPVTIAEAPLIFGPVIPKAPADQKVIVWIERREDKWSLKVRVDNETGVLSVSRSRLSCPTVAQDGQNIFVARPVDKCQPEGIKRHHGTD